MRIIEHRWTSMMLYGNVKQNYEAASMLNDLFTLYKGVPLVNCKEIHLKSKRFNDFHWYFNIKSLKFIDVQWFSYNFARGYPLHEIRWSPIGILMEPINFHIIPMMCVRVAGNFYVRTLSELLWNSWKCIWEILEVHHFQWISLHFAKGTCIRLDTFRYV